MGPARPKWMVEALTYLLDNLFDILTILAAIFVFIRNQFQPYGIDDIPELATWILGVMGLLAVSEMWERRRRLRHLEEIAVSTNEMVTRKLSGQVRAQDFFWPAERKVGKQDFAHAKEIYVVGMLLNRTLREHMGTFSDRVSEGANLRFVLLDPENEDLMHILSQRSYGSKPDDWWKTRILQTTGHIEDIQNIEKPTGSVMVGFLPYLPSFGMWLIDPYKPDGKIIVEIYHHRTYDSNATFALHASDDAYWYGFFRQQFEILWKSCETAGRVTQPRAPEKA